MHTKKITLTNKTGLHARPASEFVRCAASFKSDITITKDSTTVNAKSIIKILTLGAGCGSEVEIAANGEDAAEAVAALVGLIESGFGEG